MRRILDSIKDFFKNLKKEKKTEEKHVEERHVEEIIIRLVPDRRDINYTRLLPTTETAQTLYDYIYNKYMFHMSKYEKEVAETYRDLLIEIKQLAEKHWHQIKC